MRKRIARHGQNLRNVRDAGSAGLRYVSSLDGGIRRVRHGKGFTYVGISGKPLCNEATLKGIRELVIPPGWENVVICPDPLGHIQAVGQDQRGRKQYKYHPRWREIRDENKFEKLIHFARSLPRIRRRVRHDLKLHGLPRAKVLATIVKLLECSHIRVGNETYARQNHSFGLTTMRNRHVRVNGSAIHLEFRGKSGIEHIVDLEDPRLAKVVSACQHLPGQELFQYLDGDGVHHAVNSGDVNEYLHQIAGNQITAKDFRTWNGTVLAARALRQVGGFSSSSQAKKNIVRAIESVAKELRNNKAVCRRCYIHPAILDAYTHGTLAGSAQNSHPSNGLAAEEAIVLSALKTAVAAN